MNFTAAFIEISRKFEEVVAHYDERYEAYYAICENVVEGLIDQDSGILAITNLMDN